MKSKLFTLSILAASLAATSATSFAQNVDCRSLGRDFVTCSIRNAGIVVDSPDDYGFPIGFNRGSSVPPPQRGRQAEQSVSQLNIEALFRNQLGDYFGWTVERIQATGRVNNRGGGQLSAIKHWPNRGDGTGDASSEGQSLLNRNGVDFNVSAWNLTIGGSARNTTINATGMGVVDGITIMLRGRGGNQPPMGGQAYLGVSVDRSMTVTISDQGIFVSASDGDPRTGLTGQELTRGSRFRDIRNVTISPTRNSNVQVNYRVTGDAIVISFTHPANGAGRCEYNVSWN